MKHISYKDAQKLMLQRAKKQEQELSRCADKDAYVQAIADQEEATRQAEIKAKLEKKSHRELWLSLVNGDDKDAS